MATKKSTKSKTKSNTSKTTKSAAVDPNYCGKCFVALALIITALLFGLFYYMGQAKTHEESKRLEAFETLARAYIYDNYSKEGVEVADLDNIGITEDDDLYLEFTVTKYEEHVPTLHRKQRIHFQCDDNDQPNAIKIGCGLATWIGEWEEVSKE